MKWSLMLRTLFVMALVWLSIGPARAEVLHDLLTSPSKVVLVQESASKNANLGLNLSQPIEHGSGSLVRPTLTNRGKTPIAVSHVVLADIKHMLPGGSALYGEAFTMLSQTGGTLAQPADLGAFTDRDHYRLPEPEGLRSLYGMATITLPAEQQGTSQTLMLGYTSCKRFNGKINVSKDRIQLVIDTEGLTLNPGETWQLEELFLATGTDRNALLDELAERLLHHHPRQSYAPLPTGWCSWYCFGRNVTAQNILDNLQVISERKLPLKYVQVDDGYQPWMGDWLETGSAFGGDIRQVLAAIRDKGFEPAIWVAPFIASPESKLFQEHPDWFVKDAAGVPLPSDQVTFGGWRLGPWYMLDGAHPEAQQYLEHVFKTMRTGWGCTYFKLDANAWGAMPFGKRHDPGASSVEAYRQGMAAIRRGAGDAFLLGCNHPMWPSLGEVHGSRSSQDIARRWNTIAGVARENLMRNWQNNRLWWNDPDCLVLTGRPENETAFHTVATYGSGGMMLSGDDLAEYNEPRFDTLTHCLQSQGQAARFESNRLEVGRIAQAGSTLLVLLNWLDKPTHRTVALAERVAITDLLTGESLGTHSKSFTLREMPGKSGRLLQLIPAE